MNRISLQSIKLAVLATAVFLAGASLTGCGGGGAVGGSVQTVTPAGKGTISMTVKWPARTRIIPSQSNEIIVTVYAPGTPVSGIGSAPIVQTATITRPPNSSAGATSTIQIQNLPPTSIGITTSAYLLQIEAYNASTTNGAPLAGAFTTATVTAGQNTVVNVTLASTLSRLEFSGVPTSAVGGLAAGAAFDVDLNGNLTVGDTTTPYPQKSIPLDASTAGVSTVTITPRDATGSVLLLAPAGSTGFTNIFTVSGGSAGVIGLTTGSSGQTALTTANTPTFGIQNTGAEGGDSFTVVYNDDGTTVSFPVPVTGTAEIIPWVSLTLNNTPPQFDGPSPLNVATSATITEASPPGAVSYSYTASPSTAIPPMPTVTPTGWTPPPYSPPNPVVYGNGTITFNFYNVRNHQHGFTYSYSLNGLSTTNIPVPFKVGSVSSATTSAFPPPLVPPTSPPSIVPTVQVATRDASADAMLLLPFTTGDAAANSLSVTPSNPPVAVNVPITATFGTASSNTTNAFPANLFTVAAGVDTTVPPSNPPIAFNALTFSQYMTQVAPAGYPATSLSSLTPVWMLDYFTRTGTMTLGMQDRNSGGGIISLATTGKYSVTVLPSAGVFGGGGN